MGITIQIMSMKNSNYTIENRTHDLPACSAVPQPYCKSSCALLFSVIAIFSNEWKFTVEQKLTVDSLYCIIMWFWPKSRFHHKTHQLSTVALNCKCEGPTAFCRQSQLKAWITVTCWIRSQVLFPLTAFSFVVCRRAVQICWGTAGTWLVVAQ